MTDAISPFMAEAIRLSKEGMLKGEGGPFGAVIVQNNKIIGSGWNRVLATNDPTAHAEITAIRNTCRSLASYRLENCSIYVNCEPCPMCLAAIYWSGIREIVFAASRRDAERIGFRDAEIYRELTLPNTQRSLSVRREEKATAVHIMEQWPTLLDHREY